MVTKYVNTLSTAGGNGTTRDTSGANRAYATQREALDAIGASLSDSWRIYCEGSVADTSDLDQGAWDMTTTAANFLEIIGEQSPNHPNFSPSKSGKYDTSLYRVEATNRNGLYNNIPAHLRIEGVQVKVTVTDASSYVCFKTANANVTVSDADFRVGYCIVQGVQTSGSLVGFESRPFGAGGAGTSKFYNCVAFDCNTNYNGEFVTTEFLNCTAMDSPQANFLSSVANGARCINCLASGAGIDDFLASGAFASGSSNNASEDATAPGTSSRTSQTFTFVDAGSNNFHLAKTDAGAKGFGTTDPGAGLYNDDCDGQVRSGAWDIGFDQVVPLIGPRVQVYPRRPQAFAPGLAR